MELISLNCNGCGAALDVGPETRFATCRHCGARLAVKHTHSAAFTELIDKLDRKTDALADQVAELQRQNELEQIDRDWERERQRYLVQHKNGSMSEPNAVLAVIAAAVISIFGIVWLAFAMSMGAPPGFSCFGVMFVVVAIALGASQVVKAREYAEAEKRYRKRRMDVQSAERFPQFES